MWIVEVNLAGRRFVRELSGPRRLSLRFGSRAIGWLPSQRRHPRAA